MSVMKLRALFPHHRGRPTTNEVWVFGIVGVSQQPALGYMEIVQACDAATLLPIIQAHTAPGTTVHSDQWQHTTESKHWGMVAVHSTVKYLV